jgi:hypothetical protein
VIGGQNVTREQIALSKAVQLRISVKSIQEPAPRPAWKSKPLVVSDRGRGPDDQSQNTALSWQNA